MTDATASPGHAAGPVSTPQTTVHIPGAPLLPLLVLVLILVLVVIKAHSHSMKASENLMPHTVHAYTDM